MQAAHKKEVRRRRNPPLGRNRVSLRLDLFSFSYSIPWLYPSTSNLSLLIPLAVDFFQHISSYPSSLISFKASTLPPILHLNPLTWHCFLTVAGACRNPTGNVSQNPSACNLKRLTNQRRRISTVILRIALVLETTTSPSTLRIKV